MTTFVTVGNATQPFHRLIRAVSAIMPTLPQPVIVQHGKTHWTGVAGGVAKPFVEMEEFDRLVASATLLIMHAGAGSVIHAISAGKVPVVMPRRAELGEIIDNHQVELARALAGTGKVVLVEDPGGLAAAVAEALKRQAVPRVATSEAPLVGIIRDVLRKYAAEATG